MSDSSIRIVIAVIIGGVLGWLVCEFIPSSGSSDEPTAVEEPAEVVEAEDPTEESAPAEDPDPVEDPPEDPPMVCRADPAGHILDGNRLGEGLAIVNSSAPNHILLASPHTFSVGDVVSVRDHVGANPSLNFDHTVTLVPAPDQIDIATNIATGGTGGVAYLSPLTDVVLWRVDGLVIEPVAPPTATNTCPTMDSRPGGAAGGNWRSHLAYDDPANPHGTATLIDPMNLPANEHPNPAQSQLTVAGSALYQWMATTGCYVIEARRNGDARFSPIVGVDSKSTATPLTDLNHCWDTGTWQSDFACP